MGVTLFAEYLDGIAKITISASPAAPNAKLSALTIGSLTLSPTFDGDTTAYTASTSNATNTITATAADSNATIAITHGDTPVTNGTAATWEAGENTVTITVTNGTESKTYTITVTKT
ncbi:MAG: cadherin-like beta sandwich domain-containing protein [Abditibacteriota bacterium]|nr:cadherin-like beta sandwich domain-containing protein [Abditibacteriota bacterium]